MAADKNTKPKESAEQKQDPRDLVIAVLVALLLMPFVGMLYALTYRLLWDWFFAPQYGEGPALRTWFGIGILYTLVSFRQDKSGEERKDLVRHVFERVFLDFVRIGTVIIAAAMARVVWGWR
jgi:hypothetical protein